VTKKLYVGNLDYSTTEMTLNELFSQVGEVVSVNLITDRMTGRSKGFAFVEMSESSAAKAAIEQLNGKMVGARPIKVDQARPKRENDSPWGGGGGGRGGRRRRY
jgi:RNA recognition motif-containing protein